MHSFPLDNEDLASLRDEDLARMFAIAPKIHKYGAIDIARISKSLVIKGGRGVSSTESCNMIFAMESFHLRAPTVHRVFTADIPGLSEGELVKGHFIVMDYIPGPTVEECWDILQSSEREAVADQVAAMIEKMQLTPLGTPPGPLGDTEGRKFEGPWFTDYGAGPFVSLQALEDWCNHKIDICIHFKQLSQDAPRFKFHQVVLTHQDIAPRNLILDTQGTVWIIDWGLAGAYPPGFEQAVIREPGQHKEFADMVIARLLNRRDLVSQQFSMISYGLSVAARL
jgi:aminoglycoside phosphotransferase (APT) family kinase protein